MVVGDVRWGKIKNTEIGGKMKKGLDKQRNRGKLHKNGAKSLKMHLFGLPSKIFRALPRWPQTCKSGKNSSQKGRKGGE